MNKLMRWTWPAFCLWLAAAGRLPAAEPKLELVLQTGHTDRVTLVALSGDGTRVLTGSIDKTVTLWDAKTGEKLHTFAGHTDWVTSVALSGDGARVLTGSRGHMAILWDGKTGAKLRTFPGRNK